LEIESKEGKRGVRVSFWSPAVTINKLFCWAIVAFWVVMMALLFHQEVLPGLRMGAPANYRSLLGTARQRKTVRMGIYAFDRRLGTTVSTVTPRPDGSTA